MSFAFRTTIVAIVIAATTSGAAVWADQIYSPVGSPILPQVVDAVPPVDRVPGKEHTEVRDMTYAPSPHASSPGQLGLFDGQGGAQNGINLAPLLSPDIQSREVDAQGSVFDALYDEVRSNRVPLIVSASGDNMLGATVALAAERAAGPVLPFASSAQVVNHAHAGGQLTDIDSVQLYGIEGQTGTSLFSLKGDTSGTSIFQYNGIGVIPYISRADILVATGLPTALIDQIDVDALMGNEGGINPFDGQFGPGDSVMFSLAPISNVIDGGEIWVWDFGLPAQFLNHGGHLWDTAFAVQGTLGGVSENVDAIAAASTPEPSALVLALVGLGAIGLWRSARRRKPAPSSAS
jgi:MYXO-CTERM domain-containing protein